MFSSMDSGALRASYLLSGERKGRIQPVRPGRWTRRWNPSKHWKPGMFIRAGRGCSDWQLFWTSFLNSLAGERHRNHSRRPTPMRARPRTL